MIERASPADLAMLALDRCEADLIRGRTSPDGWVVEEDPDPAVEAVKTPDAVVMGPVSR